MTNPEAIGGLDALLARVSAPESVRDGVDRQELAGVIDKALKALPADDASANDAALRARLEAYSMGLRGDVMPSG